MADSTPDAYATLVSGLLDAEADRRAALEQKGSAIIATAGTLVTLLFGLIAVVTGQKSFTLPGAAHGWLLAAIVLFVVACFFGILAGLPVPYGETELSIRQLIGWKDQSLPYALLAISSLRLKSLATARRMNAVKAWIVMAGSIALIGALAMLGVSVAMIFNAS